MKLTKAQREAARRKERTVLRSALQEILENYEPRTLCYQIAEKALAYDAEKAVAAGHVDWRAMPKENK